MIEGLASSRVNLQMLELLSGHLNALHSNTDLKARIAAQKHIDSVLKDSYYFELFLELVRRENILGRHEVNRIYKACSRADSR